MKNSRFGAMMSMLGGLAVGYLGWACDTDQAETAAQPQQGPAQRDEVRGEEPENGAPTKAKRAGRRPGKAPPPRDNRGLHTGDQIPMTDRPMKNVDDSQITIASVAGEHGTLVVFTCNHCPWAQAWEERLTDLGNTYNERGVGVIAINANDPSDYPDDGFETMQERARAAGMTFPYVVDDTSDVARAFRARQTPEVFLFDTDGKLVYQGAIDDNAHEPDEVEEHYLRDALEALIAGNPIENARTRAMGCSIKLRPS